MDDSNITNCNSNIPPPIPPRNNVAPANFQNSQSYGGIPGVPYRNPQSPWSPYHQQYGTSSGYYNNTLRYFCHKWYCICFFFSFLYTGTYLLLFFSPCMQFFIWIWVFFCWKQFEQSHTNTSPWTIWNSRICSSCSQLNKVGILYKYIWSNSWIWNFVNIQYAFGFHL